MQQEEEKKQPGLAYSEMTERCYFVHGWKKDGTPTKKTDVTEELRKIRDYENRWPTNGREMTALEVPLDKMVGIWIELRATVQIFDPRGGDDFNDELMKLVRADEKDKAIELIKSEISIDVGGVEFSTVDTTIDAMFIEEMQE